MSMDFYINTIKILLTSLILGLSSLNIAVAQQTYYYKQVNVVKGNTVISKGSGGQFISFFNDICYDSNNRGVSVNNGTLDKKSKTTNAVLYRGSSYWGNVTYQFSADLSRLSVIKQDGTTYIYQRATAPSGVTTCSLIKSKSSGGSPGVSAQHPTNYGEGNTNAISGKQGTTQRSTTNQNQKSRHKCYHCNGTGEKVIDPSRNVPKFGLDDNSKEYCSKCGQYFKKGTHAHISCGHCGGKGYEEY